MPEPLSEPELEAEFEALTLRAGLAWSEDRRPEMLKAFKMLRDLMTALDQPWIWSEEPAPLPRLAKGA